MIDRQTERLRYIILSDTTSCKFIISIQVDIDSIVHRWLSMDVPTTTNVVSILRPRLDYSKCFESAFSYNGCVVPNIFYLYYCT